jgi:hypothetical protein
MSVMFSVTMRPFRHMHVIKNYNEFCRARMLFVKSPQLYATMEDDFTLMNEQLTEGDASEFCT